MSYVLFSAHCADIRYRQFCLVGLVGAFLWLLTRFALTWSCMCYQLIHVLALYFYESFSGGWWSIAVYLLLNVVVLGFFYVSASPKYDSADGSLVSAGSDLSQRGVMDFAWDFIYVTWFCEVVTLFSAWLWLLMLVVRHLPFHPSSPFSLPPSHLLT